MGERAPGQQGWVRLAMPEPVGDVVGDEPFDHRGVDEPEQPVVGADEQAARPDGVGDLLGGHVPLDQRGEGRRDFADLLETQERLSRLPQSQREGPDRRPQIGEVERDGHPWDALGASHLETEPGGEDLLVQPGRGQGVPGLGHVGQPGGVEAGHEAQHARVAGQPGQVLNVFDQR